MKKQSNNHKKAFGGNMRIIFITLFIGFLSACSTVQTDLTELEFETVAITNVAWGEQVQVTHSAINASPAVTIKYRIGSGPLISITNFHQQNNRVVFALPELSSLPALTNFSAPYSISASEYAAPLTAAQVNQYANRGLVKVTITAGGTKIKRNYQPFGAVEAAEVMVMAQTANCVAFETAVVNLGFTKVDAGAAGNLCYLTVESNSKGTAQAISQLNAGLDYPNLWVDKNGVQSLDPRNGRGFDPSCDQITDWLDRAGGSGFDMLLPADLLASSNAPSAHNAGTTGDGVNVFVVGGGIGANDAFECLDSAGNVIFEDHDTHIAEIISLIAPDASIEERIVCNAAGNCPTSEIVRTLLELSVTAQNNTGKDIINMSLGGPLPNTVLERALKAIEAGITVVTSGGNGPNAAAHYPANYSSSSPAAGSLDNIISVAASAFANNTWNMAGFNTRKAELFAPATNLCLSTATAFRCDPSAASQPENLGITGSSFAAPIATGVAALYLEASSQNLQPEEVRTCLTDAALNNPNLNRMIWFDASICP